MIKVIYDAEHPELQDCPLGCIVTRKGEGIIIINPDLFYRYDEFERKWLLLHEEGHIMLDTSDEIEADAYAFDYLVNTEYRSMKRMLELLDKILSFVNWHPSQEKRKQALYRRALQWDKSH